MKQKTWVSGYTEDAGATFTIHEGGLMKVYVWDEEGRYAEFYVPTEEVRDFLKPSWAITTYDSVDYSKGPLK